MLKSSSGLHVTPQSSSYWRQPMERLMLQLSPVTKRRSLKTSASASSSSNKFRRAQSEPDKYRLNSINFSRKIPEMIARNTEAINGVTVSAANDSHNSGSLSSVSSTYSSCSSHVSIHSVGCVAPGDGSSMKADILTLRVHDIFLVETELIDKLDILVSENKGDEDYKQLFNTM
uniref:Uncharacterized protein n=1 Tax=Lepeophtheirus salmonis TaxID=72036 RepID=A0A0K2UZ39_LEPSM